MIVVPELKTVFITPPRTGSTSLRSYFPKHCPNASVLSYHGEFDLIPRCLREFQVIGIIRDPVERLSSLYNFIRTADQSRFVPDFIEDLYAHATSMCFEDWLLYSESIFTRPVIDGMFYPKYTVNNDIAEPRKTYEMYFGNNCTYLKFDKVSEYLQEKGLPPLPVSNSSGLSTQNYEETLAKFKSDKHLELELAEFEKRFQSCYELFKKVDSNV